MKIKTFMKAIFGILVISLCFSSCGENELTYEEEAKLKASLLPKLKTFTISCAGDCTLGTDVTFGGITFPKEVELQNEDYSYFFKNVKPYFENDDLTIVNFEGTLTERGVRAEKTFAFRGKGEYAQILTEGSVEAVTLANNHSLDYGSVSMEDTKKYLEDKGIIWFCHSNTRVVTINDIKVGLVGLYCLDGSAYSLLPECIKKVQDEGAEVIIVQFHWGIEGDNYPSVSQVSLAHEAVDLGADLVIGHHPHVLQGMEEYKGKMILYSLGNFCFGGNSNPRDKDTVIFRQTFSIDEEGNIKNSDYMIIPCLLSSVKERNNYQPTPATGEDKRRIEEKMQKFSDAFGEINIKFYGEKPFEM